VSERLALGGQAAALIIRKSQGAAATYELLLQAPVLFDQIADDLGLPASNPAAERSQEELEMNRFDHFRRLSDRKQERVTHLKASRASFRTVRGPLDRRKPAHSPTRRASHMGSSATLAISHDGQRPSPQRLVA
jgi:hypothetical protein